MSFTPLRLQQIFGGNPDNYGIEDNPLRSPTFQNQGPMDPMDNAQPPLDYSPTPPEMMTQDSVLKNQEQGGVHPARMDNWLRLKSIMDSFTPETRATTRYNDLLDTAPQMEAPSLARKIAAAGASMGNIGPHFTRTGGGQDAADRVMYAPYLRQMADLKEKAGLFQPAAQQENTANVNERTLTGNLLTAASAMDKTDQASEDSDKRNSIAQQKVDNDRIKAQAYALKESRPDYKWDTKGPTVIVLDENGVPHDTGLKTSNLTDFEKLQFDRGTKLAVVGAQGSNQLAVQGSRNAGALATQASRNAGGLATAGARGTTGAKGLTPAAVATDRINKVNEILANHPELKDYITVTGRNITMNPPKDGLIFKAKPELKAAYDQAKNIVYPPTGTTNTPVPSSTLKSFGDNIPDANPDQALHKKAADYVAGIGLPVTEANIAHAIKTGRVK